MFRLRLGNCRRLRVILQLAVFHEGLVDLRDFAALFAFFAIFHLGRQKVADFLMGPGFVAVFEAAYFNGIVRLIATHGELVSGRALRGFLFFKRRYNH